MSNGSLPEGAPRLLRWASDNYQVVIQHPLVASLGGAAVAWFKSAPGVSTGEKGVNAFLSLIAGVFGGPALNAFWGIKEASVYAFICLASAAGGALLLNAVFEWARTTRAVDWPIIGPFLRSGMGPSQPPAAMPPAAAVSNKEGT